MNRDPSPFGGWPTFTMVAAEEGKGGSERSLGGFRSCRHCGAIRRDRVSDLQHISDDRA